MEIEVGDMIFIKGPTTKAFFVIRVLEILKLTEARIEILYSSKNHYYKVRNKIPMSTGLLRCGTKITKEELETYKLLYFN